MELAEISIASIFDHNIHGYKKQNSRDDFLLELPLIALVYSLENNLKGAQQENLGT
jgi:hypothetical protein